MTFIAFGGEKRIADLVTRAYGKLKASDAKRAAAALVAANPQLEELNRVGRGRPIAVPAVRGVARRGESDVSAPLAQGVEGLRTSLDVFASQLREAAKLEKRDLDETRSLLDSDDLRSVLDGIPEAGERLERISQATEERAGEAELRAAFVKRLKKVSAELADLTESHG